MALIKVGGVNSKPTTSIFLDMTLNFIEPPTCMQSDHGGKRPCPVGVRYLMIDWSCQRGGTIKSKQKYESKYGRN